MSREFKSRVEGSPKIELRDFLAVMMPDPPMTVALTMMPNGDEEFFMNRMRERYRLADRIIKEIR